MRSDRKRLFIEKPVFFSSRKRVSFYSGGVFGNLIHILTPRSRSGLSQDHPGPDKPDGSQDDCNCRSRCDK